jgi:hypothetical protein
MFVKNIIRKLDDYCSDKEHSMPFVSDEEISED